MADSPAHTRPPEAASQATSFADLRRHNEYAARVARAARSARKPRLDFVIQAQRRHRTHQSR